MKAKLRIFSIVLLVLFLLTACSSTTTEPETEAPTPKATNNAPESVEIVGTVTDDSPAAEVPEDTVDEPTPVPAPTREPKEGDITDHFPDYDTGVDADYSYQSDELRIAITVKQLTVHDDVYNKDRPETMYVADIWVRNLNSMRTAFANGGFKNGIESGELLARRENAILAVNGSYNLGLVLQGGKVLQYPRAAKGWNSKSVCLIYKDGSMKMFVLPDLGFDVQKEIEKGAWIGWQFGPIILQDGEAGPGANGTLGGYKARNVLGYYEPGHYVLVNCDAYQSDADGMTGKMIVEFMKSLGVKYAYNLDGGTSAAMVFMGEVINRPTPQIVNGEEMEGRELADMLLFGEYDENGTSPDLSTLTPAKFLGRD